jgi:LmbE family N-acetylglucosaminyl deacetylase
MGSVVMMPQRKEAAVIVAHPDDETLWAGGAILERANYSWTIVTLCRRSDTDRAPRFFRAIERLGATGAMADLDDGPDQAPLDVELVEQTIFSLLPYTHYDLLMTHSPFGEYTRHRRHEETGLVVTQLWASGRLNARELWLFAYEDGDRQYFPRAIDRAHHRFALDEKMWQEKIDIIENTYGFQSGSWEIMATPRTEAFWRFDNIQEYLTWFDKEREYLRGDSK